jgi:hypothetical protein
VVGHAGARLVADVAEVTGLTALFGDVLAVLRQRQGATIRAGSRWTWR